ncbi:unnamed protein product, partial [Cladocopium goreaui]
GSSGVKFLSSTLDNARWQAVPVPSPGVTSEYDLTRYNRKHCNKRRANFVTWNVAGLSQSKLDEVRHWALTQNITALALVETRWPWTSEWQDPHWQYVHSGDPSSRSSGILIMISRTISTDLRWRECLPGRLVHVQLRLSPRYLDFLACYQFCFQSNAMRQADRQRWWECLETTLSRLPRRHVLAIVGDFNCSLTRQTHHIGCTFQQRVQCRTAYLEDSGLWQDFLHKSMHTVSDHLRQSDLLRALFGEPLLIA